MFSKAMKKQLNQELLFLGVIKGYRRPTGFQFIEVLPCFCRCFGFVYGLVDSVESFEEAVFFLELSNND